ncbi:uncharacterized protein BDZ99DRAFT_514724 [Mytilinidion resinicola]|uniref:Uncharacterized protein n=1 Tax=Mytilinidion resinicola TaxID=574789 RepID=A0A6A6Z788_9PEZI|nr:uncharacterized protein BDZ99DRAFT_514724 [Mytilinidion resinicola]KAF2816115.1 hypothetical protein BDZ99DRAFT_514724 [Mytilinidion resinicola]
MSSESTNEHCKLANDPDLTGLGVRLSVIIPVLSILALSLVWTIPRARTKKSTIAQIEDAVSKLNALQLSAAIVLLAIALSKQESQDWFHVHFILNTAGLSGWSTVLTAIVVPDYFTETVFQIPVIIAYFALAINVMLDYQTQLTNAIAEKPECYPQSLAHERYWPMWILWAVGISLCIAVSVCNRESWSPARRRCWNLDIKTWRTLPILALLAIPTAGIGAGLYVSFWIYPWLEPLLAQSEDEWTVGQIIPLGLVVAGSVATLWQAFGLDELVRARGMAVYQNLGRGLRTLSRIRDSDRGLLIPINERPAIQAIP